MLMRFGNGPAPIPNVSVDSSSVDVIDHAQGNPHEILSVIDFLFNSPHKAFEAFINAVSESRHQGKLKNVKGKAPATNSRVS
ncbi:hypothetical protein AMTR_s00171p00014920 [Amborella trichopoda]|uniref:Uncharacterized protein n=1 Tax=Amborella trichopoda TaxID=13333 RepID=W1PQ72_AMBTC|nr:hypothetical protein AMTR_s00171p00014920 [Amborella trichopoda]